MPEANDGGPCREPTYPQYKSHKIVEAFKIGSMGPIGDGLRRLYSVPLTGEVTGYFVDVDLDYIEKHDPQVGGYYVRCPDGYESWSPAEAFESGYHPWQPPAISSCDFEEGQKAYKERMAKEQEAREEFGLRRVHIVAQDHDQDLGLLVGRHDGGREVQRLQVHTTYIRELELGDHIYIVPLTDGDLEHFMRLADMAPAKTEG